MPRTGGGAPARLRAQPSWLINQVALPATRLVSEGLAAAGSRRYQYALLAALDEMGPASQAELGRHGGVDGSDVVAALNELAALGYVVRTLDPSDRRRNVVSMTPAGRHRLQELDRLLAGVQDELLGPLAPEERAELTALLTRLVDHHADA